MPGELCLIRTHHAWPEPIARKYFLYLDSIHFIVKSQLNYQHRHRSRSTTQKPGKIFINFTQPQCQLKYDWLKCSLTFKVSRDLSVYTVTVRDIQVCVSVPVQVDI